MGTINRERLVVRVPVCLSSADRERLIAHCEDEVRSIGSWFRHAIRRAWRTRKPPRRLPERMQRVEKTADPMVVVMARVTETEKDQLEVLCGDEGVWPSIWFRRRLEEHWEAVGVPIGNAKKRKR